MRQVLDRRKSSVTTRSSLPSNHCPASPLLPASRRPVAPDLTLDTVLRPQQVLEHKLMTFTEEPSRLERQMNRLRGWFLPFLVVLPQNGWNPLSGISPYSHRIHPGFFRFASDSQRVSAYCGADGSQPMRSARTLKSIKFRYSGICPPSVTATLPP